MLVNFSWLVPKQIAGAGRPGGFDGDREKLAADLDLLYGWGIRAIVSLTECGLDGEFLRARDMTNLHLPVVDMQPPTLEEVVQFMDFVQRAENENRPVVVHCGVGRGRTGTMLACYLVRKGYDAQDALAQVRQRRPGSVETPEQEAVVHNYDDYLKNLVEQPV